MMILENLKALLHHYLVKYLDGLEKKKYKSSIVPYIDTNTTDETYCFEIFKNKQFMFETDFIYKTYDDVELSMLEKLIELEEKLKYERN
jgi:hypothetical protein